MEAVLKEVEGLKTALTPLAGLPGQVKQIEDVVAEMRNELAIQSRINAGDGLGRFRKFGRASEIAARDLGASLILHLADTGRIGSVIENTDARARLLKESQAICAGNRKALTTSNVALPETWSTELRELIEDYGVARQHLERFPIGAGTAKPPRMGFTAGATQGLTAFNFTAINVAFSEKTFTAGYASLESHKIGGYVLVPRELLEQGAVDIGAYLMRYGAVRFAIMEDTVAFLADGTATYESIRGIAAELVATNSGNVVTLDAGETSPSDITIDDARLLRTKVSPAALRNAKYFAHQTMEVHFRSFNTEAEPNRFVYREGGGTLDGFPVVWTNVLQPYTADAAVSTYPVFFGDPSWWWMGEHGTPRIDKSDQVYFINDQVAFRFIEEIDVDYNAPDAMAVIKTAAA